MAKIKTIGNKKELVKKQAAFKKWSQILDEVTDMSETQLAKWFNLHFSDLPDDQRNGLEWLAKGMWANANIIKKILQNTTTPTP